MRDNPYITTQRQRRRAVLPVVFIVFAMMRLMPLAAAEAESGTLAGQDLPPGALWTASGSGQTSLRFDPGLMENLGMRATGSEAPLTPDEPREHVLAIETDSQLELHAHGSASEGFAGGALKHGGNLLLHYPGGSVDLSDFTLSPASHDVLELLGRSGETWFELDYIHMTMYPERGLLSLAHMDVRISASLAERLGEPRLAGLAIGQAFTSATLEAPETEAPLGTACTTPNWHDGVNFITDVELYDIEFVQQVAREAGVRVAIAPSARLRNVGTADVPWYPKFHTDVGDTYPQPYDRDQHPYLAWALYRESSGIFEQLGTSELKHAFSSLNSDCDCAQGNILWSAGSTGNNVGCTDVYGYNTNDNPSHLGIRAELAAFTGAWEQCGSMFAPLAVPPGPCTQTVSGSTSDEFLRRLVVPEADLGVGGASYWLDAWYVVRDDVSIFNSMARVAVTPALVGSTWMFSPGETSAGPAIDAWVAPGTSTATSAHVRGDTGSGHYSLAVKVTDLGGGNRRYVYALMNFDFDAQFDTFALALPPGASVGNLAFADADADSSNDWVASAGGGQLAWNAPNGTGLDWGRMATFQFETQAVPVQGTALLSAEETAAELIVPILALTDEDVVFLDGFEDPAPP